MAVSEKEVGKMRSDLDKCTNKLLKLENKWSVASIVQRLSSQDQSRLLKASVAARTLTVALIPKLKHKIDAWLAKKEDRLLHEILADYEVIDDKVRWAFDEFRNLESGCERRPKTSKNERDKALSLSIEQSLKQRRDGKTSLKPGSSSRKDAFVLTNKAESSKSGQTDEDLAGRLRSKTMSSSSSKDKRVKEQFKGGGDMEGDLLDIGGGRQMNADEKKFLEKLQRTVAPADLAWLMQSKQALAASRDLVDLDGEWDEKDGKTRGKRIEEKVKKRLDDQRERAGESVRTGSKDGKSSVLKAQVPHPVPIDTFLNFVESLPCEIQQMVKEQTDTLCAMQEEQIFSKKQLSDRRGRMVSMDNLKDEYKDDRFDASDFKIRVPDSLINKDHLKWMKEQKVDDAVERYFGTFRRQPAKLKGDVLDAILEDDFMERLPADTEPEPEEDADELLEKYHFQRVDLKQEQDF